jgi:AraC-like DNA-binding protein
MERLRLFSDALNQRYGNYALEPIRDPNTAWGSFSDRSLDTVTVGQVEVESLVSRRPKLASHLQDLTFIVAPLKGELVIDQYERSSRLVPGDVLILDSMAGCTIAAEASCSALSIEVNRRAFTRFGGLSEQVCARKLEVGKRAGGLFVNVVSTITSNLDRCDPRDGELISDVLASLIFSVARDDVPMDCASRNSVLIAKMREWVRSNVQDSGLSPERLAKEFGLSRRGIYRQFAMIGTTPQKWLWDIRLEYADERLRHEQSSVSEIAYSVGFNDSGHFSRLYKRRYGRPPTMRHRCNERLREYSHLLGGAH